MPSTKTRPLSDDALTVLIHMHHMDTYTGRCDYHHVQARATYGMKGRQILRTQAVAFVKRGYAEEHPDNHLANGWQGMRCWIRLTPAGIAAAILAAGDRLYDEAAAINNA